MKRRRGPSLINDNVDCIVKLFPLPKSGSAVIIVCMCRCVSILTKCAFSMHLLKKLGGLVWNLVCLIQREINWFCKWRGKCTVYTPNYFVIYKHWAYIVITERMWKCTKFCIEIFCMPFHISMNFVYGLSLLNLQHCCSHSIS